RRHKRMFSQVRDHDCVNALEKEAIHIHQEDIMANQMMGKIGTEYIRSDSNVMTHCNAGALATGGHGTALGVIREAYSRGKIRAVFANETRPWFQGSRLTAWELMQDNIAVNLLCDSAAGSAIREHAIDWIIVGADRVAANGDVANKIGTFNLAVLARHMGKKFMVVAPSSTIDIHSPTGRDIEIEIRDDREITFIEQKAMTAGGVKAWNPVFDITPAELVDVLVTECGAIENPDSDKIDALFK
ncbi:MAG: S-methyl-5-thioribose-1-phosphate isomerase, partial [Pseudomonadota bacterium]